MVAKEEVVRRDPNVMWKRLGSEVVTLNRATNQYHILNAAASLIFEWATGEVTVEAIAKAVSKEFDIGFNAALTDVQSSIDGMRKLGLLLKGEIVGGKYEKPSVREITEKDFSKAVAHGADIAARSMLGA